MTTIMDMLDSVKIIVDSREHKLVKIFKEMEAATTLRSERISIEVTEINSADFAIIINDEMQILIERKTLADYACSIKDKRIEKRKIMYDQRETTKCDLAFLIEGNIYGLLCAPSTDKICGISTTALRTSIFNLQVRDKMFVYFSQSIEESALVIYNLAKSYFKNYASSSPMVAKTKNSNHEKIITMPIGCSDVEILRRMLLIIPGITENNVDQLSGLTFHQIYTTCESLKDKIGTRAINSILSLNTSEGKDLFWHIICEIPGVSEKYKERIYPIAGYNEFITFSEEFRLQILHVLAQKTSTISVNIYKLLLITKLN